MVDPKTNLYYSLQLFMQSEGKELSEDAMAELEIPLADGGKLLVPVLVLKEGVS